IHAGEIDGKDAGFLLARELLEGKAGLPNDLLAHVTFVFVPVFNVDGSERVSKNNRPNQRGPAEMGWRTTAQNLNLNRDYMKVDAPEMRAMLALLRAWDPVLYVDLHVTDGAQFQHDVSVTVAPDTELVRALQKNVVTAVNKLGHKALDFYPSFDKDDDPSSGFTAGLPPPRFSTTYWALHGRIGMLVETHSWKDYATRVKATHDVLVAVLAEALAHGAEWKAMPAPDAERVVLAWEPTGESRTIDFLGYEYTRTPSAISGALRTRYDEKKPAVWKVPFRYAIKPALTIDAPFGYVVPPEWAALVKDKLDAHGVESSLVSRPHPSMDASIFRAVDVKLGDQSYEGHQTARVKGAWSQAKRTVLTGSLFVPVHQRLGALAVHLLEPLAPDSLLAWGFMNGVFEQKEYMESYVAEAVGAEMLKDKTIAAEFAKALDDPAFAKDPQKRLDFFYRKHPSWDDHKDLYPVFRVGSAP
ncbi:MAG TPA: M14 family zinc carboxypeptidase, partial [Myxococcota bacterium]